MIGALIEVLCNGAFGAIPLVALEGIWGTVGTIALVRELQAKKREGMVDACVCGVFDGVCACVYARERVRRESERGKAGGSVCMTVCLCVCVKICVRASVCARERAAFLLPSPLFIRVNPPQCAQTRKHPPPTPIHPATRTHKTPLTYPHPPARPHHHVNTHTRTHTHTLKHTTHLPTPRPTKHTHTHTHTHTELEGTAGIASEEEHIMASRLPPLPAHPLPSNTFPDGSARAWSSGDIRKIP